MPLRLWKILRELLRNLEILRLTGTLNSLRTLSIYVPQTGLVGNDIEIGLVEVPKLDIDFALKKM